MLTFLAGDANRDRFSVSGFSADTRKDHVMVSPRIQDRTMLEEEAKMKQMIRLFRLA